MCLYPENAHAQTGLQSDLESKIREYSIFFQDSTSSITALFSGKIQPPYNRFTESLYLRHRGFREEDVWGKELFPYPIPPNESYAQGNLLYDGIYYTRVYMRLDLVRDELVVRTANNLYGIILDPEKLQYADFHGYRILYIAANDPRYNLPPGYYQLIHDGENRVMKKETFQYNLSEQKFINRSIKYYIEKEGTFHRVKQTKGSILKVLREHRRELDRMIKGLNLNIRRDMEASIVTIVSEYEQLNRQAGL